MRVRRMFLVLCLIPQLRICTVQLNFALVFWQVYIQALRLPTLI